MKSLGKNLCPQEQDTYYPVTYRVLNWEQLPKIQYESIYVHFIHKMMDNAAGQLDLP